jgi:hypothetical protein
MQPDDGVAGGVEPSRATADGRMQKRSAPDDQISVALALLAAKLPRL